MKKIDELLTIGIMRLFNSEQYYMKITFAIWVLRAIVLKEVEYVDNNGYLCHDEKSPHYWIYQLTNELIGSSWISGYDFLLMGRTPYWNISNRRTGDSGFLSYEEAKSIAYIFRNKDRIAGLYSLKALTESSANDTNNPASIIYELTSSLLNIVDTSRMLYA